MKNKTIAVVDLNNFHNQYIELLLISSIIEKKLNNVTIVDLNAFGNDTIIKQDNFKKMNDLISLNLFSNTTYIGYLQNKFNQESIVNKVLNLKQKNNTILINFNSSNWKLNSVFNDKIDQITIFYDFNVCNVNSLLNYLLNNNIKNKPINLVLYNFDTNIQSSKKYIDILSLAKGQNISIDYIDIIPNFDSLSSLENIDPWLQIYKLINQKY